MRTGTKKLQTNGSWTDNPERGERDAAHLEAMEENAEKVAAVATNIVIPQMQISQIQIKVVGDSELICHRWSEKAKKEILDKQMGAASPGKQKKDPVQDFVSSLYCIKKGVVKGDKTLKELSEDGHPNLYIEGGTFGFPSIAFKNAMVSACTSLGKSITKVAARQCFHIVGEHVIIEGQPRMRCDMVRVGMGIADIRFRGGFTKWSTLITIKYNARVLTVHQIVNLLNTAGFAVGIGEWRSDKDGSFGLFHVDGYDQK